MSALRRFVMYNLEISSISSTGLRFFLSECVPTTTKCFSTGYGFRAKQMTCDLHSKNREFIREEFARSRSWTE